MVPLELKAFIFLRPRNESFAVRTGCLVSGEKIRTKVLRAETLVKQVFDLHYRHPTHIELSRSDEDLSTQIFLKAHISNKQTH